MKEESYFINRPDKRTGNGFDPKFKYEIASQPGGENILKCFQCGTCAGICPVFEVDEDFYPQKIIKMALLGMREEVLSSKEIWLCSTCYSCYEYCPQNVKVTELMCAIQNIATKDGYLAPALEDKIKLLKEHARTLPIDDFDNKKRSKFNLPSIVEKPSDIASIIGKMGIEELVEHSKNNGHHKEQEQQEAQEAQETQEQQDKLEDQDQMEAKPDGENIENSDISMERV